MGFIGGQAELQGPGAPPAGAGQEAWSLGLNCEGRWRWKPGSCFLAAVAVEGEGNPGRRERELLGPSGSHRGLAGGGREVEDGDGDDLVGELEVYGPTGQIQQLGISSIPGEGLKECDGIRLCCPV